MKPIVAAFDFDCTLTSRDSLIPFFIYLEGPVKTYWKIFKKLPYLIGFVLKIVSRQQVKEAILTTFFKGMRIQDLKDKGRDYAKTDLKKIVLAERMERVHWHQKQGHRCILISASLDIYLSPWSKENKFNDLLCSRLQVDKHEHVTGKLSGLNCRGSEKTRRLEELLGPKNNYILYAYGDSAGDRELLALADYPTYGKFEGHLNE